MGGALGAVLGIIFVAILPTVAVYPPLAAQENEMTLPLPRDPEMAVQEEFQTAERSNTPESWQRFILRHDGHPLAETAKRRLKALQRDAD